LSCPKSIYGIGGIGAQSFAYSGSKRNLLTLNKAIQQLLPNDFLKQNKAFQYKPIRTIEDEKRISSQVKGAFSDEISFNYLFTLSPEIDKTMMPTQIPIVLPEAIYIPREWGLDPDVLDYQISALLIQPHIDIRIQERLQNLIKKIGKEMLRENQLEQNLDFPGVLKLAKSWARLQYQWELKEDDFTRMKNDLEEPFKEFFDLIEDAKAIGRTYHAPLTQMPDKRAISINATKVFQTAKQIRKEIGMKNISRIELRQKIPLKEISVYDFERALDELVLTGYFLKHKNGTEYELVI